MGDKHRALARRLIRRIEDYLRFATDPTVPWDNNAAEREIRMPKLRQKVSGGMRTLTGAEHFAALRSYLATTGKHGIGHHRRTHQTHHRKPLDPRNNPTSYSLRSGLERSDEAGGQRFRQRADAGRVLHVP